MAGPNKKLGIFPLFSSFYETGISELFEAVKNFKMNATSEFQDETLFVCKDKYVVISRFYFLTFSIIGEWKIVRYFPTFSDTFVSFRPFYTK